MIIRVSETNIFKAAEIYSLSWNDSHKSFCTKEFLEIHDLKKQLEYLQKEIQFGKELYMLIDDYPVGIVSIYNSIIENLYILPNEQNKKYGTKLLLFAVSLCKNEPTLWILKNNKKAYNLYTKYGFKPTGKMKFLSKNISEIEMKKFTK